MSYTEFLRRKAAAAPKIIDTTVRSDASTITMRRRLQANREFFTSARQGVITNVSDPSGTGTASLLKSATVTTKASGGRIPDASTFTAFMGGDAINGDGGVFQTARRYVANSNDAGSISSCVTIADPIPFANASQFALEKQNCYQPSTEPHIQNELGAPVFVDNTIRLKHLTSCCVNNNDIAQAIHTHPADVPHNDYQARPLKGNGGIPVFTIARADDARKVGSYNFPRDHHKYVEKHHGNDLNVNPRQVPIKYQIPAGSPAHLKINDPNHYPVA
jgi:hypothetical protein